MRKTNIEKIDDIAEKIAALSHQLDKLAKKEFGDEAFVFISDDEGISICDRAKSGRSQSMLEEVVYVTGASHAFNIGSW